MRAAFITFITIAMGALMLWILRGTHVHHPAQLLPLVSGSELNALYEIAGVVMAFLFIAGIARMLHRVSDGEDDGDGDGDGDNNGDDGE